MLMILAVIIIVVVLFIFISGREYERDLRESYAVADAAKVLTVLLYHVNSMYSGLAF